MCTLFANKLYSTNTYFYSPVWIMIVYNNFDAQNLLFICLQISPQIFAILQNFAINNLRDQQFCTLLCELERPVVVLFTGIALEVEVPPGMVCAHYVSTPRNIRKLPIADVVLYINYASIPRRIFSHPLPPNLILDWMVRIYIAGAVTVEEQGHWEYLSIEPV